MSNRTPDESPFTAEVRERLRMMREVAGLTLKEINAVSTATAGRIEIGPNEVYLGNIVAYCDACRIEPKALLGPDAGFAAALGELALRKLRNLGLKTTP